MKLLTTVAMFAAMIGSNAHAIAKADCAKNANKNSWTASPQSATSHYTATIFNSTTKPATQKKVIIPNATRESSQGS